MNQNAPRPDLSHFSSKKLRALQNAAWDVNANLIRLLDSGLLKEGETFDLDGIVGQINSELNLRQQVADTLKGMQ